MLERIRLDPTSPLEEQIYRHLRVTIANGTLGEGEPLPSARVWATDLHVHWNTVARAYRRLAEEGLLQVRPRRRTVVRRAMPRAVPTERSREAVRKAMRDAIFEAHLAGLSRTAIRQMFLQELRGLDSKGGR